MYIRVHVIPGARKEYVERKDEMTYYIAVKEPRERNMANIRVRELLAQSLGISTSAIKLLTGHRSPTKLFVVETVQ